jgi:hypothetical protein
VAVDAGDRETSNTEPRLNVGTSPSRMPSTRSLLATALAAALAAVPMPAQAADVEYVDRSTYDSTPVVTTSTIHIDGATAGPLGGFLDLTVSAEDGTLPTTRGACDPVDVDAVLTVSPGEQLVVHTTAEVWMHQFSETLIMQAYFDKKDLSYSGTEHSKAKVVGDGSISASNAIFFGFAASFSTSVRW